MDISISERPGPVKILLPRLPYVPGTGRMKALGLNQALGVLIRARPPKAGFTEGRSGLRVSPSPYRIGTNLGGKGKTR